MAAQQNTKKPVSAKAAMAVANMLKKGGAKAPAPKKAPVNTTSAAAPDAEDAIDGGADEAQE
jgi:hypothetical protein